MITISLAAQDDFDCWREQARSLIAAKVRPADIHWQVGGDATDLFASEVKSQAIAATPFAVPRAFVDLAKMVICHRDAERFALLYRLLFDLRAGERKMDDAADPLIRKLSVMAKGVRRDIHKMRAFLRFREITTEAGETFVAWYEPEHHIVRTNAAFFLSRFANMRWSILTPELSLHWDGKILLEGPAAQCGDAPSDDAVEEQWHVYYRSIFNPARLKVKAMLKEMPRKYWRNMPETAFVPGMIQSAQARMTAMIEKEVAIGATTPEAWELLQADVQRCRRCPLYAGATQLVFGEGPKDARLMLVGEQPGDEEDKAGRPFVGPAGRLLNEALIEAGIERDKTYVTNAVKHFKFEMRGKRRIHEKPNTGEIDHCRWWLTREIELIRPDLIIALGATAIRSLTGKTMTIKSARVQVLKSIENVAVLATVHPSYLLRLPDRELAAQEHQAFVDDLRRAHDQIALTA